MQTKKNLTDNVNQQRRDGGVDAVGDLHEQIVGGPLLVVENGTGENLSGQRVNHEQLLVIAGHDRVSEHVVCVVLVSGLHLDDERAFGQRFAHIGLVRRANELGYTIIDVINLPVLKLSWKRVEIRN